MASHPPAHSHDRDHSKSCSHSPQDTNLSDANKDYFNANASKYDAQEGALEMARRMASAMREIYAFDENKTIMMEFACGTGNVSRELAAYTKSIVGVDVAQGMVDIFNEKVFNQGIPPEEMKAVCLDLKGITGELDDTKFDVIVCTLAYHHFESIENVTKTLNFFLKPGGHLLVGDILWPESSDETLITGGGNAQIIAHRHGISIVGLQKIFVNEGLGDFKTVDVGKATLRGIGVNLFLACAQKSPQTDSTQL